jgi:hypothetical protein
VYLAVLAAAILQPLPALPRRHGVGALQLQYIHPVVSDSFFNLRHYVIPANVSTLEVQYNAKVRDTFSSNASCFLLLALVEAPKIKVQQDLH